MKRFSSVSKTIPGKLFITFAVVYGAAWLVTFLNDSWRIHTSLVRSAGIVATAAIYGIFRITFHPAMNPGYVSWLRKSPWTPEDALPLGPVHLIWSDYLTLGVLTSLTVFEYSLMPVTQGIMEENPVVSIYHWAAPTIAFMTLYVTFFLALTVCTTNIIPLLVIIAAPAIFCFLPSIETLFVLSLVCYGMNLVFLKRSLTRVILEGSLENPPLNTSSLGWPTNVLMKDREAKLLNTPLKRRLFAVGFPLISTVYLYALVSITGETIKLGMCVFLGVTIAVMRGLVYLCSGLPPVSLLGRLVNKRWIVPKYDKAFIAPLLILVLAIGLPYGFIHLGLSKELAGLAVIFTTLWAAFGLPPSLNDWHYCGCHRYVKVNVQASAGEQSRKRQKTYGEVKPLNFSGNASTRR